MIGIVGVVVTTSSRRRRSFRSRSMVAVATLGAIVQYLGTSHDTHTHTKLQVVTTRYTLHRRLAHWTLNDAELYAVTLQLLQLLLRLLLQLLLRFLMMILMRWNMMSICLNYRNGCGVLGTFFTFLVICY